MLVSINAFIRRRFVHLISACALLAFLTPGISAAMRTPRALGGQLDASGVSLFLMMLSAAVQCSLSAFKNVITRPRALALCLAQIFVLLPASCWLLGQLCVPLLGKELGEPIQIGLYLVILMPVAATASIWVRDTRGDLELLVSLVVLTMSLGTLTAPAYLYAMSGLTTNSILIPPLLILRQLVGGVLLPLVVGLALNRVLGRRLSKVQPWFAFGGTLGLFMAVYINVGTAAPLLRHVAPGKIGFALAIVLAVNVFNFLVGGALGRMARLGRAQQVTCEFSSGMRSNGSALVVGLASFPTAPLVTVPAAIYIIFQHLIASVVQARLLARDRNVARVHVVEPKPSAPPAAARVA
jgi:BASS family bile acid:Na+ symporter